MSFICNYTEEDIQKIATIEYNHHPKAMLRDYYKLFFQAYWGQGHFVGDAFSARMYLKQEVSGMQELYNPIVQDISNSKCLYRVSLSVVKEQLISAPDFISAFLDNVHNEIDWVLWKKKWDRIRLLLDKWYPDLIDAEEIRFIDKSIEQQVLISHSECFRLTYNPHYRVMQLNSLNSYLINRLKEYI
jgi:hypothetical protein